MQPRPSGTVSFLFTDVAGSTRLWDADRTGMAASLATHDAILTSTIGAQGGYVFSTAGDSYGAAFPTAKAAMTTALEAQLALASEDWAGPPIRVRMGIHTGASEERAGNYFGPEVNRAARVMSAANGGQILVSETSVKLAGELPPSTTFVDRGVHALKDLDRPEHIFELRHPHLPEVLDPLHTLDVDRVHLPIQLTAFVGRDAELAQALDRLASSRLVTLTGAGGTGKTRLAIETANNVAPDFPDGVWMAELAAVTDESLVVNEIAELWGLRPGDGIDLIDVVTAHLRGKRLLLVMDNCEHVLGACTAVVSELLRATTVSILATSRESIGISGEAVFRVPSLGLPSDPRHALESDAIRLFLDRADRVVPGFAASSADLEAVIQICRRLDGIPLGIELAAARLRTLTPRELADRLEQSFRILSGGAKGGEERQRTLDTAIGWSYELLDQRESALFGRLATFSGTFDLGSAEVVGVSDGIKDWEVLDLIDQLVDKSLVVATRDERGSRFRLLEPIRQFAEERLTASGEASQARLTHAVHYADRVAAMAPRLRGPNQRAATDELAADDDNIRTALRTLIASGRIDSYLRTCVDLFWFWVQSGHLVEGRAAVLDGLAHIDDGVPAATAARAWWAASGLAVFLTDSRAIDYAERGLELATQSGDAGLVGWLTLQLGTAESTVGTGRDTSAWLEEAERLIRANPDSGMFPPGWDGVLLDFFLLLGGATPQGDVKARLEATAAQAERLGDHYIAAMVRTGATYLFGAIDEDSMIRMLRESVSTLRDLDFRHGLGHALFYLGVELQRAGSEHALDELAEASEMLADVGDVPCSTWAGELLIRRLVELGEHEEARRHLLSAARRLLAFDREVPADLVTPAIVVALADGDPAVAARLVGHAEARGADSPVDPTIYEQLRAVLPQSELDERLREGADAGHRRVLEWMTAVESTTA